MNSHNRQPWMFQTYTDPLTGETYTPTSGNGCHTKMAVASEIDTHGAQPDTFETRHASARGMSHDRAMERFGPYPY